MPTAAEAAERVLGQAIIGRTTFSSPGQQLPAWTSFAPFCAYTAVVLTAAALTLNRSGIQWFPEESPRCFIQQQLYS